MALACKICFRDGNNLKTLSDRSFIDFVEYIFSYAANTSYLKPKTGDSVCLECYNVMIKFYNFSIRIKKLQEIYFENASNSKDKMISILPSDSNKLVKMIQQDLKPNLSVIQKGIDYYFAECKKEYVEQNISVNDEKPLEVKNKLKISTDCLTNEDIDNDTELKICITHKEEISPDLDIGYYSNKSVLRNNEPVLFEDEVHVENINNDPDPLTELFPEPGMANMMECSQNSESDIYMYNYYDQEIKIEPSIVTPIDISYDDKVTITKSKRRCRTKKINKTKSIARRQIKEKDPQIKLVKKKYRSGHFWDGNDSYDKLVLHEKRNRKQVNYKGLDSHENRKNEEPEDDFNPNEVEDEDASSSSSLDFYTDSGRKLLYLEKRRVYPRQCEKCDVQVENGSTHYRHYFLYHDPKDYPYAVPEKKGYLCTQCGYETNLQCKLRDHERTHAEKTLQCDKCPKRFYTNKTLLVHMKYHKELKYTCDYCRKAFADRATIVLHIRTHTGEKPFACHICGAAFAHKGNVGIHIKNKHAKDPSTQIKKKRKNNNDKKLKTKKVNKDEEYESLDDMPLAKRKKRKKD